MTIPVPSITGSPLTAAPLWRYDEGAGRWVSAGSSTYDATTSTYASTIDRPAYWNADQPYATACWTGLVTSPDGLAPQAGIKVAAEGVTYHGESIAWTDANGRFTVRVMATTPMRAATARIYAEGTARYVELPPAPTPTTLASTGSCTDVGALQLAYPLAEMVLTWGARPSDLDSHFTGPIVAALPANDAGLNADASAAPVASAPRFHVSYSSRNVGNAFLDTDDTSSYGPEVTSLLKSVPGDYVYAVQNFTGEQGGPIVASSAQVTAILPKETRTFDVGQATVPVPITRGNTVWRVFKFHIDDVGVLSAIEPIQQIVDDAYTAYDP